MATTHIALQADELEYTDISHLRKWAADRLVPQLVLVPPSAGDVTDDNFVGGTDLIP